MSAPLDLEAAARAWQDRDPNSEHRRLVAAALEAGDRAALTRWFGSSLAFGTAGVRALVGPGPARMNHVVVRRLVAATLEHAANSVRDAAERGLCIAFDGRRFSAEFAHDAACLALGAGFRVRMFTVPSPTPLLAFTTRLFDAACGVMITASHNPAAYSGVKVYWEGGGQVLAPHDHEIALRMRTLGDERALPRVEPAASERFTTLGDAQQSAYVDALRSALPHPSAPRKLRVAYTALKGVGSELTHRVARSIDLGELHEVREQAEPDATFAGIESPNPENHATLTAVLALAHEVKADLAIAHDPDADRMAAAARDAHGALRVLSGDQVGVLLGHYLLSEHEGSRTPLVITTHVSSSWLGAIARGLGARSETTLTGFKWIAQRAREVTEAEGCELVFGYEEAIGYALGKLGDDKDGISALALLVELASQLKARGLDLWSQLDALAARYGLFATRQLSWQLDSDEGLARIAAAVRAYRQAPPEQLIGENVTDFQDAATWAQPAELLIARTAEGTRVALRPSGTEPKLKAYLEVLQAVPGAREIDVANERAQHKLDALEHELRARLSAHVV